MSAVPPPSPSSPTASSSSSPRIRLLTVDDCAELAMAIDVCLEDHPHIESLGWVDAAATIVTEVERRHPDVVLLDLTMPDGDPLEELRRVRERRLPVKVIAFSGDDTPETIDAARRAGADAFLRKTSDPCEIASAVLSVIDGKAMTVGARATT